MTRIRKKSSRDSRRTTNSIWACRAKGTKKVPDHPGGKRGELPRGITLQDFMSRAAVRRTEGTGSKVGAGNPLNAMEETGLHGQGDNG